MATSFNLQEYILFRTEIKRELTNSEVDTNFKMVSNPWVSSRVYEIGNIVYHPVIVDDPSTTGEDQVLAWWRSNTRTTQGVFDTSQWDMIGGTISGIGSGNINIQGANSFGKINVNYTGNPGLMQTGANALVSSLNPNDTFNFIAGAGIQLQYNIGSRSIAVVNTLASNPGEVNIGENIGLGTTHQDIYSGKVGVNLQFYGLDASNTGAGSALTVVAPTVQNNVVYNFNEGLVDLTNLNSGSPTISMLSNVSNAAPTIADIFQWDGTAWGPVPISVIGSNNIYGTNGSISISARLVQLNGGAGNLEWNRAVGGAIGNRTGINFSNTAATHQIELKHFSTTGTVATRYSLDNVVRATAGFYGTDGSFGINLDGTGLVGLSADNFSISGLGGGSMYVPQIATDAITTVESFRIPLVDIGATNKGRFDSTSSYRAGSYSDQGGTIDMISILHEGDYTFKGVSNINAASSISFSFDNEHDFAANTSLTDGYGILMSYKTPTNKEADTIINHMDKTNRRFTGYNFAAVLSTMPVGSAVNKYLGSNITLDDMSASTPPRLPPSINVGSIINFSDTTLGAAAQPQRIGLYSNVVSSYTGAGSQDGEQVLTQLMTDSGTWAGIL